MALPPDDPPPGVPEWVVTYGDMMSLLLTFFIMLVSLSEVKANKKYRAVLESLQKTLGYRAGPISPPGNYFPLSSRTNRPPWLGSHSDQGAGKGGIKAPQTPDGDDHRVYIPRQGKSIAAGEMIDFPVFGTRLDAAMEQQVATIARQIAGKPNKIEICGHSSSRPLPAGSDYPNLLTLSYARARSVYDELIRRGVEPERLRVVAVADHRPLPASHDAHELHEDRVEVQILDAFLQDYVGPRDTTPRSGPQDDARVLAPGQ